jgi:hypothetical protein
MTCGSSPVSPTLAVPFAPLCISRELMVPICGTQTLYPPVRQLSGSERPGTDALAEEAHRDKGQPGPRDTAAYPYRIGPMRLVPSHPSR